MNILFERKKLNELQNYVFETEQKIISKTHKQMFRSIFTELIKLDIYKDEVLSFAESEENKTNEMSCEIKKLKEDVFSLEIKIMEIERINENYSEQIKRMADGL